MQVSEDDNYIYCGTTSGDILQVFCIFIVYYGIFTALANLLIVCSILAKLFNERIYDIEG